jgi:hypothetical protein
MPVAPDDRQRRVDGQASEPGIESVRIAKAGQVAPGADEALLDRIVGELGVPKDQSSGCVQLGDRRAGELGKAS